MTLMERIEREGQKKLLAIDGGGIRCVLALEVLQGIEDLLKKRSGKADFRLADYFDYIAVTSAQIQSDSSSHPPEDRPESGIEPMGGEPSV